MTFKEHQPQFQTIDVTLIEANPANPRRQVDEASLAGLVNSIRKTGIIHPLLVLPANADGRYRLIVGERRWRAALLAGEKTVPALIHPCDPAEVLEIQVFENLGLGLRAALEPRDMANAIQALAERFENREAAAEHFGRSPTWLNQATSAATANLSPKITALLDSGKLTSTSAAIKLEKLARKDEAKAESLLDQIEQLPEGKPLPKKIVDRALSEEGAQLRKLVEISDSEVVFPPPATTGEALPNSTSRTPVGDIPAVPPAAVGSASGRRINPGKVKMVATLLGLEDGDEEEVLARLIDEFLALKGEGNPPF